MTARRRPAEARRNAATAGRDRALRQLATACAAWLFVATASASGAPVETAALAAGIQLYYKDRNYPAARAALQAPAELGESRAQYLLGSRLLKGEGGEVDAVAGYGWLRAAAENGNENALGPEDKVRTEVAALPPEARGRALDVASGLLPLSPSR